MGPGGVHGREGQHEPGGRLRGGLDSPVVSGLVQGNEKAGGGGASVDAAGRVAEGAAGALADVKQGPQGAHGALARVAVQRLGDLGDVTTGDLTEVLVAAGPGGEGGQGIAQVVAYGQGAFGPVAGRAVAQDGEPVVNVVTDAGRQSACRCGDPGVEGRKAVVVQHAE